MKDEFAGFFLISRIGRGGMGETFVAEWVGPGGFRQRVCLKRALVPSDDAAYVRMFLDEAKVAAILRHPSIVTVHAIGEFDGYWWMSMDLVEGMDLGRFMNVLRARGEQVPMGVAVFVTVQLAEALAYAHARAYDDGTPANIVHRDVKPANILLGRDDGSVRLTDFGIAKHTLSERTRTGHVKGTIAYMSPEQAAQKRDIDHRSDLFSLGITLFEMLAGRRPFDGARDTMTMLNIAECRFQAELPSTVPPELRDVVMRMLQKDPADRPFNGEEVADVLAPLAPQGWTNRTLGKLLREVRPAHPIPREGELTEVAGATDPMVTVREKR